MIGGPGAVHGEPTEASAPRDGGAASARELRVSLARECGASHSSNLTAESGESGARDYDRTMGVFARSPAPPSVSSGNWLSWTLAAWT